MLIGTMRTFVSLQIRFFKKDISYLQTSRKGWAQFSVADLRSESKGERRGFSTTPFPWRYSCYIQVNLEQDTK